MNPDLNSRPGHRGFYAVPIEDRFWDKVDIRGDDECWEWQAFRLPGKGYGRVTVDGKRVQAHRIAWELHYGEPIPDNLLGCHHCDNPSCCNPRHIFPGTHADNMRDMDSKGRRRVGVRPAATHCKHGHEFTEENTYSYESEGSTKRACRICRARWSREYEEKRS